MAKPNNESCQEWYYKMRQDDAKLAAYRKRKRDWQRKNRGYKGGQTEGSYSRQKIVEAFEQREQIRVPDLGQVAGEHRTQTDETA